MDRDAGAQVFRGPDLKRVRVLPRRWANVVAVAGDGETVATATGPGSESGKIDLWNLRRAVPVATDLPGHGESNVYSIAFRPKTSHFVTAGGDTALRVRSRQDGRLLATLLGHSDWITSLAFSRDGDTLASASRDGTVRLWDMTRLGTPGTAVVGSSVDDIAVSRAGKLLVVGQRRKLSLLDLATRKRIGELRGDRRFRVADVTVDRRGTIVAAVGDDDKIRLWRVGDRRLLSATLPGNGNRHESLAFHPDGRFLIAGTSSGRLLRWKITGEEVVAAGERRTPFEDVWQVAWNGPADLVASANSGIVLWNAASDSLGAASAVFGRENVVLTLALDDAGRRLVSADSSPQEATMWDLRHRPPTGRTFSGPADGNIWDVAFSPDGSTVATASAEGATKLWDSTTLTQLGDAIGPLASPTYVAEFSSSPNLLITSGERGVYLLDEPGLWTRDERMLTRRVCNFVARNLTRNEWKAFHISGDYRKPCPRLP